MITPVAVEVTMTSNKGQADFTVKDSSDGLPIEAAGIAISSLAAGTTDAQGKYSTGLIAKGTYNFTVSKTNYNLATGSFTV